MKVLVTGGKGYIGTNLRPFIEAAGWEFVSYDIVDGLDVLNFEQLQSAAKDADVVVHLAAVSGVEQCNRHRSKAFRVNVEGTWNVVNATTEKPVFIASSFASVWNVYGQTKRMAEIIAEECPDCYIMRISNVYGGREYVKRKNSVIAKWLKEAEKGYITVYGDGTQQRDFIHVDDVCRCIRHLIQIRTDFSQELPKRFNICTGKLTAINELSELFRKLYPSRLVVKHKPLPSYESVYIAHQPFARIRYISLEEGLARTIKEVTS